MAWCVQLPSIIILLDPNWSLPLYEGDVTRLLYAVWVGARGWIRSSDYCFCIELLRFGFPKARVPNGESWSVLVLKRVLLCNRDLVMASSLALLMWYMCQITIVLWFLVKFVAPLTLLQFTRCTTSAILHPKLWNRLSWYNSLSWANYRLDVALVLPAESR